MKKRIILFLTLAMSFILSVSGFQASAASPGTVKIDNKTVNVFNPIRDAGDAGDHVHGSSIVELPSGELLSVWFQGNGERDATTTRIMGARSQNGGKTWAAPFVMADSQDIADINPAVYVDKGERLWLFWYPVLAGRWETSQPKYAYAEKGSYEFSKVGNNRPKWTWSEVINVKLGMNIGDTVNPDSPDDYISPILQKGYVKTLKAKYEEVKTYNLTPVKDGGAGLNPIIYPGELDGFIAERLKLAGGDPTDYLFAPTVADRIYEPRSGYPLARRLGWQTKNKPFTIPLDGGKVRMLLPLYSDTMEQSMMAITEYDPTKPLEDNSIKWTFSEPIVGIANIQASMAQRKDGTLVAYMRDNGPIPSRVVMSESSDGGFTWTIGKDIPELLDPGVGHDLSKLKNGSWVFVHVDALTARNSLTVALSDDEGRTWKYRRHIAFDTRVNPGSYHYPAVSEANNGDILITFTRDFGAEDKDASGSSLNGFNNIIFTRVDEDWIKKGDGTKVTDQFVYDYDNLEKTIGLRSSFDMNAASDQAVKALLPATIKGYLTYGKGGVNEELHEIALPVNWDINAVRANFKLNRYIDGRIFGEIDLSRPPEGVYSSMLPAFKPQLRVLFYKDDSARTILSIQDATIKTKVKTAPALPGVVTAEWSDGTGSEVAVSWDKIDPSKYAKPGAFDVMGTVKDTTIKAVAHVYVNDQRNDDIKDGDHEDIIGPSGNNHGS